MTKLLNEEDFFETQELLLASIIHHYGYTIEATNRINPKKVAFLFRRNKELDELIQSFWKQGLRVEPVALWSSLRFIKSLLKSNRC